jgi:elongation factor G
MAHESPKRIRNVALLGHRGSGKTSVNEALLFTAGAVNRLGSVADGTTVSDSASDEKTREMSISAGLSSFRWDDRKINLIDTPGDPSFVADALCALRVCEGAVFVVNGVMGVEVTTSRLWERASELGLSRILFVNMLDRERADFFRSLESLKQAFGQHVVATEIPIGVEHELEGLIDLIDMKAYRYDGNGRENCSEVPIPDELADRAQEMREKLMDEVAEVSDELMERYLEGEEISHEETVNALKTGVTEGKLFPVTCGAATRNLGINRLLDAFVEDLPSPAKRGEIALDGATLAPDEDKDTVAFVFKTLADPYAGRVNLFRVYQGVLRHDSHVQNCRAHVKERIGQLLVPQGKDTEQADEFGPGDIGAVAKLKETHAGDVLADKDLEVPLALPAMPRPVMAFAIEAKAKGDEEKMGQALRRLQEEDPTIDFHRDDQTGEQILAGLTQVHVEVIVDRMKERFGVEVELHQPHVPYREAIKAGAKAHARYKKQTGGRGQFADCHIEIEPMEQGGGFEFVNAIKGGVIPGGFIPAVEKGVREAMRAGVVAGFPVQDVRVRLFDGQHHSVDSSEMAFKIAGSMAFKDAMENAQAVLMEPIMTATVTVPEQSVGDVIGDLNSRRGRPLGMEPKGSVTEVKAARASTRWSWPATRRSRRTSRNRSCRRSPGSRKP